MDIAPLRNLRAHDWQRALERDGFRSRKSRGSHHLYQHPDGRRVLLVYHNLGETFGPKTIRALLRSGRWTEADLRRLGLLT
jgi:predicted RNA binding protein YcfA (HicA-like mRNA interferase family)